MDFDSTWQQCQQSFRQLRETTISLREASHGRKLMSSQEYMTTYQKIYSLCIIHNSNNPEKLYKKFGQVCTEYMAEIMVFLQEARDLLLLKQYRNLWNCYRMFLKPCRNLFGYLDKFHVPQNNQMLLQKKGLTIFCESMFDTELFESTQSIYIREVEKVRLTEDFGSCSTLKDFIEIFQDISSMQKVCDSKLATLERRYVDCAGEHYRRKYREFEKLSCGQYLSAVYDLYQRQLNLFDRCFDVASTLPALKGKFSEQLVKKYKSSLLQKSTGMLWMLENQQTDSLRLMNTLYRQLDTFEDLRSKFSQFVMKNLQEHLDRKREQFPFDCQQSEQRLKNQMQFIRSVFKFHKDQSRQIEECFPNNQQFQLSYKFAIENVFNSCNRSFSISDILALYTDSIIRNKKLDQQSFEEEMRHIFNIFSCLVDKDVFIKSYTQFLAKRLINDSYGNLDFEATFKSKLKEVCGVVSVQPIDNLLSDFNVSQKESEYFSKYLLDRHKRQDFRVRLLSRGIWPTEQPLQLELIDELRQFDAYFTEYFQANFKFKTFKWSHLQSRVVFTYFIHDSLKATSKYEQYDLNMNGLQASLLYFIYKKRGEAQLVSQSFILKQFCKVPAELLLGSLRLLTNKSTNVIKQIRNEHTNENLYEFNGMLQPKRKCVVFQDYTKQTEERREEEVQNDRSLAVSMAIVKVMKARRRLKFDLLVSEVAQILRNFQPSIRLIKQSIQKMVQKDYLERDSKDISEYRYKE